MNNQIESWLTSRGAKFELRTISLDKIDRDRSLHNQARVGAPLNEETVLLYGVAMEQGSEFPPIVVYGANDKFVVIDGNHRVGGADTAKLKEIEAYVVTNPNAMMVETLTYEANANHGLPTSLAERTQQALYLVARGMSQIDAATLLHIPLKHIERQKSLQSIDMRIYKMRRQAVSKISQSARIRLGAIRSDVVLQKAIDLVLEASMTKDEIDSMVVAINKERNEKDQLFVVTREKDRQAAKVAATAGGKVALPETVRWLMTVSNNVERLDPKKIKADLDSIGTDMQAIVISKVMNAHKRLREILG